MDAPEPASTTAPFTFEQLLQQALKTPGVVSEAYRAFHRYSIGNQLLAAMQLLRRGLRLTPIASFGRWKELGRRVMKGQKALSLWLPITVETKNEAGDPERRMRFLLRRHWFSLEQTDGAPYTAELVAPTWSPELALQQLDIWEVPFEGLNGNILGYASGRTLAINPLGPLKHKTRFHEIAHIVLGHTALSPMEDWEELTRSLAEVEAESTAYLLTTLLELPGQEEAAGYIHHWLAGDEIPEPSARRIFAATEKILRAGQAAETSASAAA
jgi:N-terminal domain of anti-restriction factor ArdC